MLKDIRINHVRCLKDVRVPMRPLTVLIGQNDTGKSSFLRAIQLLLGPAQLEPSDSLRGEPGQPSISADVGQPKRATRRGREFDGPANALAPVRRLALAPEGPPMRCRGVTAIPELGERGENVPALLDYFLRENRPRFFAYVETLKEHIPGLGDVHVTTPTPEDREVVLEIDRGFRMPAAQASAGVRILLFFVALAYHPTPPKLLLIEEPENGLHPKRLAHVVRLLRALTQGAFGGHKASHPVQVVLTTHSPYLLDEIDLATDQVLVFRRQDDGSRTAEPVDAERLAAFLTEFKLGEVWFNQEESGLVQRK
jgi:predicted ATPase